MRSILEVTHNYIIFVNSNILVFSAFGTALSSALLRLFFLQLTHLKAHGITVSAAALRLIQRPIPSPYINPCSSRPVSVRMQFRYLLVICSGMSENFNSPIFCTDFPSGFVRSLFLNPRFSKDDKLISADPSDHIIFPEIIPQQSCKLAERHRRLHVRTIVRSLPCKRSRSRIRNACIASGCSRSTSLIRSSVTFLL